MTDPKALLSLLHAHIAAALGRSPPGPGLKPDKVLTLAALPPRETVPNAAEFALVTFDEGGDDADTEPLTGGQIMRRRYIGYVARHFPARTPSLETIDEDLAIQRAFESFWKLPEVANDSGVVMFAHGETHLFINTNTNHEEIPAVLTLSATWALTLDLEV